MGLGHVKPPGGPSGCSLKDTVKVCIWQFAQPKAICKTSWNFANVRDGGRERVRVIVGSDDMVMATWTR